MMLRAVARVVLPLTFAATLCLPAVAQDTSPAPNAGAARDTTPDQTATPAQTAAPAETAAPAPAQTGSDSSAQNAQTMGSSTSLSSDSNDVASLYGTPVEQIVARVNDRVITNSDLQRAQSQLTEESRQGSLTLDQFNAAQKNLLRDLIDQQLLLSKGKQLGITADTDLIKRLDDIRKQNHMASLDDLEKAVEQSGTSYEDFKANIRNSIITQAVVRQEVGSKMQVSQADIQKYYEAHRDSFDQPESIHLNEILIPTDENATPSQLSAAEAKANEVEAKLKAGASFADLAKQYSGGPTAQQGGDLGDFKRGALAKVLEDQTFDLPVGGYTGPIRTRQGYIILQVTAHTPGGVQPLQKVEPKIEEALYMERIEPAVRQYLTRLRDEAYIDIRPGFTDSAASPNETKPTFTAYVPPQPKKKKKKKRFDTRAKRYGRMSDRRRRTEVASTAAGSAAGTAAAPTPAATKAPAAAPAVTAENRKPARLRILRGRDHSTHKSKRVKLRYGQAPATPVSNEQVASAATGSGNTEAPEATNTPVAGAPVQPLGPDLEHTPKITQPKRTKTRLSDEARRKTPRKPGEKRVKKVKVDNAKPTDLTPSEVANQKVDSAPLGLSGDTTRKKKKKKVVVKNGEKTRLSDEKKNNEKTETPAGASGSSSSSAPEASQPQ